MKSREISGRRLNPQPGEAAARLLVCRNTIRTMMDDGRVQAVNLNPRGKRPTWRIVAASLEEFMVEPLGAKILEERLRDADLARRLGI